MTVCERSHTDLLAGSLALAPARPKPPTQENRQSKAVPVQLSGAKEADIDPS
jgi:hypothetical protein